MVKYIIKRLLLLIPVILCVTIIVFTIMYFVPGDPAIIIGGSDASAEELDAIRDRLGLNDPYLVRLGNYLKDVFLHGDLGESYITGVPVIQEIMDRFPRTLILAFVGMAVSLLIGIPLGVNAAVHQNKFADYASMFIALIGVSMPGFWCALMLVMLFSTKLGWLPPYGLGGIKYWILPIFSSMLHSMATQARQARSSMLEVINSDYITMARAKGLSEHDVIYKHALPNALIPLITVAGTSFGSSLGGGMVIETVFSIPGIGYYMVQAVSKRDYIVVQSCILVLAILFTLVMLVTDLIMAAVDPRIKTQFFTGGKRRKKKDE